MQAKELKALHAQVAELQSAAAQSSARSAALTEVRRQRARLVAWCTVGGETRCGAAAFSDAKVTNRNAKGFRVGDELTRPFRDARRFPSTRL